MPIKSLDNNAADETLGSSEIVFIGEPDIGKSRPFDILSLFVCLYKVTFETIKNNRIIRLKRLGFYVFS